MNDEPEITVESVDDMDDVASVAPTFSEPVDIEEKRKPEESNAGDALSRRLRELSNSLQRQPDCSTLYLLRGELFLSRREYHLAKGDFEQAIEITLSSLPEAGWGLVEQSVLDRAQQGLKTLDRFIGD